MIALVGGGTPRPIYARLATPGFGHRIDWSKVHVFFGDERCVPPDDSRSNYRMAREALLDHVLLAPATFTGSEAKTIRRWQLWPTSKTCNACSAHRQPPRSISICLGMGDNGHTASLFPGTVVAARAGAVVVPQYVEVMKSWRVTFTTVLINAARHVAFLVEGAGKAEMLWNVLEGPYQPDVLPVQLAHRASERSTPLAGRCCCSGKSWQTLTLTEHVTLW